MSSSGAEAGAAAPTVIRWVLDTRKLWPEAKATKDLKQVASRALDLLSETEQTQVLRYHFVKDAKLQLGSCLFKRYAIARFCRVPWAEATAVRDARTKPVFLMPRTAAAAAATGDDGKEGQPEEPLIFNVTHQAGLVAMFAVYRPPPGLSIGVDIVCQDERRDRDHETINTEGWPHFVDMHADVFSPREAGRLKRLPIIRVDRRLSYFYSLWCLREAYVKMTGDALLAPWLGDLEMRSFAPPGERAPDVFASGGGAGPALPADHAGYPAELEVWFRGAKVTDVDIDLIPLLDGYMISTAVRRAEDGSGLEPGEFEVLDFNKFLSDAEELEDGTGEIYF
jgi:4'-phosphopantetheinyl transferase